MEKCHGTTWAKRQLDGRCGWKWSPKMEGCLSIRAASKKPGRRSGSGQRAATVLVALLGSSLAQINHCERWVNQDERGLIRGR